MAKYMITASYSAEGLQGLFKDKATGRRSAVRQAIESVGGKLESMHYALGDYDVVIICEAPDAVAASAISLAASATGLVHCGQVPRRRPLIRTHPLRAAQRRSTLMGGRLLRLRSQ